MEAYKNVIIGFGKGGKTLAKLLAKHNEEVLIIEESDQMYGGTCINVGCIPSKFLILQGEKGEPFEQAVLKKDALIGKLRDKNYHMIQDEESATVWTGKASFLNDHELLVKMMDGSERTIKAERIFINTGATSIIPSIDGLTLGKRVVTSKEIMSLDRRPDRLVIIGAGYIGLEYASMFANFGSEVTVIDGRAEFIPREDEDIAAMIYEDMGNQGIKFELDQQLVKVVENPEAVEIHYGNNETKVIEADMVLVATGRKPNTEGLGLENTSIEVSPNGAVMVDEKLQTTTENIWAIGDVKGGLQFTYISLDDYRIIADQLFGDGSRSTNDRAVVPYTVFLTPPLSNVGLTERQVQAEGFKYQVFKQPVAAIPKAQVAEDARGMYKIIVDTETENILGASLYGIESHETINIISLAMKAGISYKVLRDQIFTHPTMAEALNDVLK